MNAAAHTVQSAGVGGGDARGTGIVGLCRTARFAVRYNIHGALSRNNPDPTARARWIRDELASMGPTYIKLGQFVSSRPDAFSGSEALVKELRTLQDAARPFDSETACRIVREELGIRDLSETFDEFDETPVAAASIAQVHRARLKGGGPLVAVKVQRPGVRERFREDFAGMTTLLGAVRAATKGRNRGAEDGLSLIEECRSYVMDELSFRNELGNLRSFRRAIAAQQGQQGPASSMIVKAPRPHPSLCTDRVVVMDYLPSQSILASPVDAGALMEFFLRTVRQHGIVHADPHAGNMGFDPTDGRIVLYDFGQVVRVSPEVTRSIVPLMVAVYERDAREVGRILLSSGTVVPTSPGFRERDLDFFAEALVGYMERVDVAEMKTAFLAQPPDASGTTFAINPSLIMVFRSLSLLEGVCKQLDPGFSYFQVIERMVGDLLWEALDHRGRRTFLDIVSTCLPSLDLRREF